MTSIGSAATVEQPDGSPPLRQRAFSRFALVSIIAAFANAGLYAVLLRFTAMPAPVANVAAATCVVAPTFLVHYRWTWRITSDEDLVRRGLAYWSFAMFNVSMSSTISWLLDRAELGDRILVAATVATYTTMWILRFFFLDRLLFRRHGRDLPT